MPSRQTPETSETKFGSAGGVAGSRLTGVGTQPFPHQALEGHGRLRTAFPGAGLLWLVSTQRHTGQSGLL